MIVILEKEIQSMRITSEKTLIDVSNLSEGIYFGKVISNNGQKTGDFKFSIVK